MFRIYQKIHYLFIYIQTMERRSVIVSLLSGISSSGTTTVTENPPSTPRLTELSFSATVVRQSSGYTPPRLRTVLTHEGETEVAVGPGQQLMFSGDFGTPVADPLIFYPASNGPETQVDGCWTAGPDDQFTPQSIVRWTTLQPGDEIRSTIDVYTLESARMSASLTASTCFQVGCTGSRRNEASAFQ